MVTLCDLSLYSNKNIKLPLNNAQDFRSAVRAHFIDRIDFRKKVDKDSFIKNYAVKNNFSEENIQKVGNDVIPEPEHFDIYAQEEENFVSEKISESGLIKDVGVVVKNESSLKKIPNDKLLGVLRGLNVAKHAFKKLPKQVVFETLPLKDQGNFNPQFFNRIVLNPLAKDIDETCVHEIAHRNDKVDLIFGNIPILCLLSSLIAIGSSRLLLNRNKEKIISQIGKYALTDRSEFLAETARKLVCEGKSWQDFDPKIQKLYKIFLGPKIKL